MSCNATTQNTNLLSWYTVDPSKFSACSLPCPAAYATVPAVNVASHPQDPASTSVLHGNRFSHRQAIRTAKHKPVEAVRGEWLRNACTKSNGSNLNSKTLQTVIAGGCGCRSSRRGGCGGCCRCCRTRNRNSRGNLSHLICCQCCLVEVKCLHFSIEDCLDSEECSNRKTRYNHTENESFESSHTTASAEMRPHKH